MLQIVTYLSAFPLGALAKIRREQVDLSGCKVGQRKTQNINVIIVLFIFV